MKRLQTWQIWAASLVTLSGVSCNSVAGLDKLSISESSLGGSGGTGAIVGFVGECTKNSECTERATRDADGGAPVPAVCVKPVGRCERLTSEDCVTVTGDYLDDNAVVIGSLFSLQGALTATNMARQQSATLAIEQLNAAGGIPLGTSAESRRLVMLSCDASTDLVRAATHLAKVGVPAIVGPNTSQDTLDVSTKVTVDAGIVVITPSAIASSIGSLIDNDLTWLMVPTDVQRAPLMVQQINQIEAQIRADRGPGPVKLGIVYRDDAVGVGTRTSLNTLQINGKPISDSINLGANVQIDVYDPKKTDQAALVSKYVGFAPDIVVLAGTAEVITQVLTPLETAIPASATQRPLYIIIDPAKAPELLDAVKGKDELRRRIRGTGIAPAPKSASIYGSFKVDYQVRYPGSPATISGMGPAYDATYAIAYALAASQDLPVNGQAVAHGLRKLAGGPTHIDTGSTQIRTAFQKLMAGESISTVGTFSTLQWDKDGAMVGGTLEMWCISGTSGAPVFGSSGLTFDLETGKPSGEYTQCGP